MAFKILSVSLSLNLVFCLFSASVALNVCCSAVSLDGESMCDRIKPVVVEEVTPVPVDKGMGVKV